MKKVYVCGSPDWIKQTQALVTQSGHELIMHSSQRADTIVHTICGCCPFQVNMGDLDHEDWVRLAGGGRRHHFVTVAGHDTSHFPWAVRLNSPDDLNKLLDSK